MIAYKFGCAMRFDVFADTGVFNPYIHAENECAVSAKNGQQITQPHYRKTLLQKENVGQPSTKNGESNNQQRMKAQKESCA